MHTVATPHKRYLLRIAAAVFVVGVGTVVGVSGGSVSAATVASSATSVVTTASQLPAEDAAVVTKDTGVAADRQSVTVVPKVEIVPSGQSADQEPASATKCNTPSPHGIGVCLKVNGNDAYVSYIVVGFRLAPFTSITGHIVVKTMLPYGTQFKFQTSNWTCVNHGPTWNDCYINAVFNFDITFLLDSVNQRWPTVLVCAFGYHSDGSMLNNHACDSIYGAIGPVGH